MAFGYSTRRAYPATLMLALAALCSGPAAASLDTYDVVLSNPSGVPIYAAQLTFDSDNPTPPGPLPEGDYEAASVSAFSKLPGATGPLPDSFVETADCLVYVSMADVNIPNDGKDTEDPTDFPNAIVGTWVEGVRSLDSGGAVCGLDDTGPQDLYALNIDFADNGGDDWANFSKTFTITGLSSGNVVASGTYSICNRMTPANGNPTTSCTSVIQAPVPAPLALVAGGLVLLRMFRKRRPECNLPSHQ